MSLLIEIKSGIPEGWHQVQCAGYDFLLKEMLNDGLVLDSSTHTYTRQGIAFPSVTQIIKVAGLSNYGSVNADILARAARFGSAVHLAVKLSDEKNLGECDPLLLPYVDYWNNFKKEFGIKKFTIREKPLYSKIYGFAGTPDAYIDSGKKQTEWMIVHLNPEFPLGYKIEPVERKRIELNKKTFLAALQIWNWKRSNGR